MTRKFKLKQNVTVKIDGTRYEDGVVVDFGHMGSVQVEYDNGSQTIWVDEDGFVNNKAQRHVFHKAKLRGRQEKKKSDSVQLNELVSEVLGVQVESLPTKLKTDFTRFWRAPFGSSRLYFNSHDNFFYSGLTTPIGFLSESKKILSKAALELAYKGRIADLEWEIKREYGTLFHLIVGMLEDGTMDGFEFNAPNQQWEKILDTFITNRHYQDWRASWVQQLKNDVAAWLTFKKNHNVQVLSTEIVVSAPQYAIATPLDIICEMDWKGKRVLANINLKTGDHPFNDDNITQVGMEQWLWNTSPQRPFDLDESFAWRPKSRDRSPGSYEVKAFSYKPENVEQYDYIAKSVRFFGFNEAKSPITYFVGNADDFTIVSKTPLTWLAEFQESLRKR